MPARFRVLLLERRPILRLALSGLLRTMGFRVVTEAKNLEDAVSAYKTTHSDVIFVCAGPDCTDAVETAGQLSRNLPDATILIWFLGDDRAALSIAIQIGVRGIVNEADSVEVLRTALCAVADGGVYYSAVPDGLQALGTNQNGPKLAPRELRVLRMIAEGKSTKEIAVALNLEIETVRQYRKSTMRKLDAHNVAGLLKVAGIEGLIQLTRLAIE